LLSLSFLAERKKCIKLNQVNVGILITSSFVDPVEFFRGRKEVCGAPPHPSPEDTGLKKRGGETECAQKNGFGAIPYFLEIADVGFLR
jgi:hypothetical protein